MGEWLLEYLSEEIPARMQAGAARDLARLATERLAGQDLAFDRLRSFVGPRRLTLVVEGLPRAQADRREERRGPRVSAPEAALAGFLRSTGVAREALVERDGALYATIETPGRPTSDVVSQIVTEIAQAFPWPKSMRSGASTFRWVRPLKSVLCLFDGDVAACEIGGRTGGRETRGHRFLGAQGAAFDVADFADYRAKLEAQFVLIDPAERASRLIEGARRVCRERGLELVEDDALVGEVAGLVEWPTPVLGDMDPAFLDLPPEVIRTSMRTHQRYFAVRRPGESGLAPHFVVVANVEARDGGAGLAVGNARVLSARLNDARFFWNEDRKAGALERWAQALAGVTFHARLGSLAGRVERIASLAEALAPRIGADPGLAALAANLCKRDLASQMVGEFPDLQGEMGGYYVRRAPFLGVASPAASPDGNEDPFSTPEDLVLTDAAPETAAAAGAWWRGLSRMDVDHLADAVRDHYRPVGPSDRAPTAPLTVTVALADKLDTLVGFFAADEKPTGSRDPFALRRAALGAIRLVLDSGARLELRPLLRRHYDVVAQSLAGAEPAPDTAGRVVDDLLGFFADRLTVVLRDRGERHDLVDAVFALGDDDLVRIVARVAALSAFLATEDGANLLAGCRRAANILRAEAKKRPGEPVTGEPEAALLREPAEIALALAIDAARVDVALALTHERFGEAMAALARLRPAVDAFFDDVLVNDSDAAVRLNRLKLVSTLTQAANRVADFSRVSG